MPNSKTDGPQWRTVPTPFEMDLFDVAHTADGPYAVGVSGTVAANREDGWRVLVEAGPAAKDRTLHGIGVTDDGKRVWFVGASGVIGAYDVEKQRKYNFSGVGDATTTWQAVEVAGNAGAETVLVASGSGTVAAGEASGVDVSWTDNVTPGTGASISAMAFAPTGVAYAVDTSGNAFKSTGAAAWADIGVVNASADFNDVYAGANGRVYVAASNGNLYRYDATARRWKPIDVTTSALVAVDVFRDRIVVLSTNSTFYSRPVDGQSGWTRRTGPTGNDLLALALGTPNVAVGKAGTVVRRKPAHPPDPSPEKHDSLVTCEDLVDELLGRLSREELVERIETRSGCAPALLAELRQKDS